MKNTFPVITFTIALLVFTAPMINNLYAQDTKAQKSDAKHEALKELITSRHFTFVAQSATPMNGNVKQLTPDYGLSIKNDTLETYLPYYGRAYNAAIGGDDDGIKFTLTNPDYTITETKKGGWIINMKLKNISVARQISISISASGYASVQVSSNNRDMISFYGYIK